MIHLFKSHYSVGRSIIQIEKANYWKTGGSPPNLVDLCLKTDLKTCYLVDDTLAGIIPAYESLSKAGIQLVFGLRVGFVADAKEKSNDTLHKNIVFIKNKKGYQKLIKLSTLANVDNFYEVPRLEYDQLHDAWSDDLTLAVPFYDSFLYNNLMTGRTCIPDFRQIKPTIFLENKELPFDVMVREAAVKYAEDNGLETKEVNSVYYETPDDIDAYTARRIMDNRKFGKGSIEAPNLSHFGSDQFCLVRK